MKHQKVLGIDYGSKRIGLALSRGSLASPLKVIDSSNAIAAIKAICLAENIDLIVMGLSENKMAEKTKAFAEKLKQATDLPLEFFDETLSSQTVEGKLKDKSIKKSKRSGAIDHYAAAEILGEWMEVNYA